MTGNKALVSGTAWVAASTASTALAQIARLSILAHFLNKEDFGVVAILTLILGITYTFSDLGFSAAVMHRKDISREEFCSLYWVQFALYILIYILCICGGRYISSFFGDSRIEHLLPITLLDLMLHGIGRLYETLLQKNFMFKVIAIRNITAALVSLIIAVVLAMNGFGIYSLIISTLSQSFVVNILNFIYGQKQIRLTLYCSFNKIKSLAKIGIWQTGTQIIDYLASQIDIIIIGRILGTGNLGLYNLAKELVMKIVLLVNSIANRVALPYFAKIQEDTSRINATFKKISTSLSSINFPICSFMGSLSYIIIIILYGENYQGAIPLLAILSIWGMLVCVGNPIGNIAIAKGKTDYSFFYSLCRIVITTPVVFAFSFLGLYWMAAGLVCVSFVTLFLNWYLVLKRLTKMTLSFFLSTFLKNFVISTLMIFIVYLCVSNNVFHMKTIYQMAFCYGLLFVILYAAIFYVFNKHQIQKMIVYYKNYRHKS